MPRYKYEMEIEKLLDKALNNLSVKDYELLLDDLEQLIADLRNQM